jgi:hypothetical protein
MRAMHINPAMSYILRVPDPAMAGFHSVGNHRRVYKTDEHAA